MLTAALGFVPATFIGEGQTTAFAMVCVVTGATLGADIAMPAAIQSRSVATESTRLARPRGDALFGLWGWPESWRSRCRPDCPCPYWHCRRCHRPGSTAPWSSPGCTPACRPLTNCSPYSRCNVRYRSAHKPRITHYLLRLPVGDRTFDVRLDDWMFMQPGGVLINRAEVSTFGLKVGEATLFFKKAEAGS